MRYADDYLVGFEYERDARQFLADLRDRLARFSLELAPEKTRLIEFGRFAARNRARRGLGTPETFEFLGFTHCCAKTKNGRFMLKRITIAKRMRTKLHEVKAELKQRRHHTIPDQGRWLASVLRGHTPTTPCPVTATGSTGSTTKSRATGSNRFGDAANARD